MRKKATPALSKRRGYERAVVAPGGNPQNPSGYATDIPA